MRVVVFGRSTECNVTLEHVSVSRKHAQLTIDGQTIRVKDLGSRNGTFVNRQRIQDEVQLNPGDALVLGEVVIDLAPYFAEAWGSAPQPASHMPASSATADPIRHDTEEPTLTRPRTGEEIIRVGRADDNDVVLNFPIISRHHCEFRRSTDGRWFVRDTESKFGTFVRNTENRIAEEVEIEANTAIYLATFRITLAQAQDMALEKRRPTQTLAPVSVGQKISIGRAAENTYRIDSPLASRKHALIYRDNDGWWIKDLGSANGTFVNGERIGSEAVRLPDQAALFIGPLQLFFDIRTGAIRERRRGDIRLDVIRVTRQVKDSRGVGKKTIVDNVSISIYPGEMVGIMGPSGAGKTELMKLMSGNNFPSGGDVLINGLSLQRNFEAFRHRIGYVPQDEIIHPELTVEEALTYSARLRLPKDLSPDEIKRQVDRVLEILGLKEHGNKVIGSPDTSKILSGGQRKRVNIGMELVANPDLLFLDEPTSGLSIRDSEVVLQHLRKIADSGTTVVLVLHSPPAFLYKLMDNVVWMAPGGKLAFYGPTDPVSYDYFKVEERTPSAIENALAGQDAEKLKAAYISSPTSRKYVAERQQELQTTTASVTKPIKPPFDMQKYFLYTQRYLKIKLRDRMNTALMLGLAPIISFILMLSFWSGVDNAVEYCGPLFYLAISSLWLGCSGAARELVAEKTIYERERMVTLRLLPYLASKLTILGGFALIQTPILLIGPILAGGISILAIPFHIALLFVTNLVGIAAGLLISSLSRTQAFAATFVPLFLIPNVIFAGMAPSHLDISRNIPAMLLSEVFPSRYSFGAMLVAERYWDQTEQARDPMGLVMKWRFYDDQNKKEDVIMYEIPDRDDLIKRRETVMKVRARLPALMGFSMENTLGFLGWLVDIGVLLGFFAAFMGSTTAVLKAKDKVR